MTTLIKQLKTDICVAIEKLFQVKNFDKIIVESPKNLLNGDLATNAAMVLSSKVGKTPREIAGMLKEELKRIQYISHIEIAGVGFINFTIKTFTWHQSLTDIINLTDEYTSSTVGIGRKINIEFVSANPTGPMHIGHARGGLLGNALANLLSKCGFEVTKEFYVNDYGHQVDILCKSIFLRYKEAIKKEKISIPEGYYPGDYLIPLGEKLTQKYQDKLLSYTEEDKKKITSFAIKEMLNLIKKDLHSIGINHDVFFYESSLYKENKVENIINKLIEKDLVYKGSISAPKGKKYDNWQAKEQLLFRSSKFGDTQDRPIQKSDGNWSYFASDIAYAQDKIDRGFTDILIILGADHTGYIKRIKAIFKALDDKVNVEVKCCQLVNYIKDGTNIKMSKRQGRFVTLQDILPKIGKEVFKFMILMRKNDVMYDFDINKLQEYSKDNPMFYIQYAYVRTKSIINNLRKQYPEAYDLFYTKNLNFNLLNTEEEINIIKKLALWPMILNNAVSNFEPHRITFYLQDVAAQLHSLWNLGKESNNYRFIVQDNLILTASRVSLAQAIANIITVGFNILGIELEEKM